MRREVPIRLLYVLVGFDCFTGRVSTSLISSRSQLFLEFMSIKNKSTISPDMSAFWPEFHAVSTTDLASCPHQFAVLYLETTTTKTWSPRRAWSNRGPKAPPPTFPSRFVRTPRLDDESVW